ncbi:MtrB/PioB family decaheme-associated outer membrane protein [Pseudothauera rhizosphaerae]|uniref:MtrB/PioB family decaheme-associated outer membrane protein n=1 Tax=Pseudothauera rhizosphaerae TaxID=2565932 RepID=A0A4S4ALE9_9RHOO|nr:MtrB/PioB family decaheme-associated outer membrane protein [Pseudothauera rhizosphaerae]THF60309.1 MtrB/PioB family decaheme-associated outer membrane protein [Pseudothauera rhizosphaerae]
MKKIVRPARPQVDRGPRVKTVAVLIGMALAQFQLSAQADSGIGVDAILGNALNAAPINPSTHMGGQDPDGLGTYVPAARTPTGQMYSTPRLPVSDPRTTEGGWQYFGFVEAGLIGVTGDRKAHGFRRYKDVDDGLYLSSFGLDLNKPTTAHFFEVVGGGAFQDDQFYGVQFGRYNDWRVRAFYNETPHVFTSTFRPLWNGVNSGNLTLKPGLTPGGSGNTADDNAAVAAVAAANAETEIGLTREKSGLRFDMYLTDTWKFYASYTHEKREGGRPFAAVWGTGGGTAPMELVEGIDYTTHDMTAGVHFADALTNFNFSASASLFRNNIDTLTFETPYRIAAGTVNGVAAGGFTQGQFDLYPDNDAYNIKGEYARRFPDFMNSRFTAVLSLGTSRQDDDLIPYTLQPVTIAGVANNNWNTTDSLSRTSADARIDTRLLDLGFALNPTNALNVKAKARYYETRNHTDFLLCNPNATYDGGDVYTAYGCSGVWGPVINNGSGAAAKVLSYTAPNGNTIIRNIPFDHRRINLGLSADWRIDPAHSVNGAYEREIYLRDHRERSKTWEDKLKVGYVNRGLENATLRLSAEHGNRRGSTYHTHHPYADFYSGYLADMPDSGNVQSWAVHMNSGLRKYDLSDRRQTTLNARLNYLAREDLDLGVSAQFKQIRYPDADYGRRDRQSQHALNFDIDWQPTAERSLYAFYSWSGGRMKQRSVPSGGGLGCTIGTVTPIGTITPENADAICQDPASNALYVAENVWNVEHKDRGHTIGFGVRQDFGVLRLDVNFTHSYHVTEIGYTLPANANAVTVEGAGSGFPDLSSRLSTLEANLLFPLNKTTTLRALYRHERGNFRDWHYQGFDTSPVAVNAPGTALPTAVILDAGPQKYRTNLFGLLLQVRL